MTALSGYERVKKHRGNHGRIKDGDTRLDIAISEADKKTLKTLSRYHGITQRELLSRLISQENKGTTSLPRDNALSVSNEVNQMLAEVAGYAGETVEEVLHKAVLSVWQAVQLANTDKIASYLEVAQFLLKIYEMDKELAQARYRHYIQTNHPKLVNTRFKGVKNQLNRLSKQKDPLALRPIVPRVTVEQWEEVDRLTTEGYSVKNISIQTGIATDTIYAHRKRSKTEGG